MPLRPFVPTVLALALAAGAASAQTPSGPGSLTVLSRPDGASFRLQGDQEVVGRTPATLARGLTGRFRVVGLQPGYERWRRTVDLDGASADTVWMALRPKRAAFAVARSLVVPGWGQLYGERPGRGAAWLAAGAAAAAALAALELRYQDRVDDYDAADARYRGASTVPAVNEAFAAREAAALEAEDAYDARQIALGVAASVWALSAIDAALTFTGPGQGELALRIEPGPAPAASPAAVAAVRVRF